jgi:dolichyl-phosphate-mannose--protein O-mannosyl transferase
VAAGWLPWFAFAARTEYFYYAVSFEPFLCLALALCIGLVIGPAYLYPVLAGSPVSHSAWLARMWLSSWI